MKPSKKSKKISVKRSPSRRVNSSLSLRQLLHGKQVPLTLFLAGFALVGVFMLVRSQAATSSYVLASCASSLSKIQNDSDYMKCTYNSKEGQISRLYDGVFNNNGDKAGIEYWTKEYKAGIGDVGQHIVYSNEKIRNMSKRDFVRQMYVNILGRKATSSDGTDYWENQLATDNTKTRAELIDKMSNSKEAINKNRLPQHKYLIEMFKLRNVKNVQGAAGYFFDTVSNTPPTEISLELTPLLDKKGSNYYALSAKFKDKPHGMYAGIQTNGDLDDKNKSVGSLLIFSVWDATAASPASGVTLTKFANEGSGLSLRMKYDWKPGSTYLVTMKRDRQVAEDTWDWTATFFDKSLNKTIKLGNITGPAGAATIADGSIFHERFTESSPTYCYASGTSIEKAGLKFSNLAPAGAYAIRLDMPNGIFTDQTCGNFVHNTILQDGGTVGLTATGITEKEFKDLANKLGVPQ